MARGRYGNLDVTRGIDVSWGGNCTKQYRCVLDFKSKLTDDIAIGVMTPEDAIRFAIDMYIYAKVAHMMEKEERKEAR